MLSEKFLLRVLIKYHMHNSDEILVGHVIVSIIIKINLTAKNNLTQISEWFETSVS